MIESSSPEKKKRSPSVSRAKQYLGGHPFFFLSFIFSICILHALIHLLFIPDRTLK